MLPYSDPVMPSGPPQRTPLLDAFVLDRAIASLLQTAMSEGPLTPREYAIVSAIAERSLSTTALAAEFSVPLTTMTDWLARLLRDGHLTRTRNPADRRQWHLGLTSSGLEAFTRAHALFGRAYETFLDCAPDGPEQMRDALARMTSAATEASARLRDRPPGHTDPRSAR